MEEMKDLLRQGLQWEQEAFDFYTRASQRVQHPGTKVMLQELALEEQRHVELFTQALAGKRVEFGLLEPEPMQDLGLAQRLKAPALEEASDPGDVLVVAMKREWAAIQSYERWATQHPGTDLGRLAAQIAAEERSHKYRLELLYDEQFLQSN